MSIPKTFLYDWIANGTGASAADKFESVITVDDEIQQTALEDLSAAIYVVPVLAGS